MALLSLHRGVIALTLSALCGLGLTSPATAAVFTLGDTGQNSELVYDTSTGAFESWTVDGIDNLFEQIWYYRVGAPAPGNAELAINDSNLSLDGTNAFNANFLPGDEGLAVLYTDPTDLFSITFVTNLTAGSPGSLMATHTQSVRIDNTSGGTLAMSLFLFADYDLLNTIIDDSVTFADPRSVTQEFDTAVIETGVTVTPTFIDVGTDEFGLEDGESTVLSQASSSFVGPLQETNGDLRFAMQWDIVLAPGRSFTLGTTNTAMVPEASSLTLMSLFALTTAGLGIVRSRAKRRS